MDFLSLIGLVGLISSIFLGIAYIGVVVFIFVPVVLFLYVRERRNTKEMAAFHRDIAAKFVQEHKGQLVEYYYMDGTCLVDFNRMIQTRLLGMTQENFILENGFKLPLSKYIHTVD